MAIGHDREQNPRTLEDHATALLKRIDRFEKRRWGGGPKTAGSTLLFHQNSKTVNSSGNTMLYLTYTPQGNSEHLYWNGDYQPASEWTRSGRAVTILDPDNQLKNGDQLWMEYAYVAQATQEVTSQIVARDHFNTLGLVLGFPDGTTLSVPNVNSGPTTEVDLGSFLVEEITVTLHDYSYSQSWTYPDPSHIRRSEISGTNARGDYLGYRYELDDAGNGFNPDGDFNDLVVDIRAYEI
jgi:hypothetical protein